MKILVLHGPNLNLLGSRETDIYGTTTLADIDQGLVKLGSQLGLTVECTQHNSEADLLKEIQRAPAAGFAGILINPAAYGHTSIALRDALLSVQLPFVEVHLSNIFAREPFRQHTYLSDISSGVVVGFGPQSYFLGLRGLAERLGQPGQDCLHL